MVYSTLVFKEMSEQLVCQPHKSKCKWVIGPWIETWVTVTAGILLQWVPGNSYTSQTHTCLLSWEHSDFLCPHQSNLSCISSHFKMDFEIEKQLHKTSQSTTTWSIKEKIISSVTPSGTIIYWNEGCYFILFYFILTMLYEIQLGHRLSIAIVQREGLPRSNQGYICCKHYCGLLSEISQTRKREIPLLMKSLNY